MTKLAGIPLPAGPGEMRAGGERVPVPVRAPHISEPTSPMKPSEALRLGSLTTEQAFNHFEWEGKYCAHATINLVLGRAFTEEIADGSVRCGACPAQDDRYDCHHPIIGDWRVDPLVQHLNDDHCWTRPQIADWLEGLGL